MVVCKAVRINPPLSPGDTPGHARSSAAERSPRGQQLGGHRHSPMGSPPGRGQLGVLPIPGGHKRTPQSAHVPTAFCGNRNSGAGRVCVPLPTSLLSSPGHMAGGLAARQPPAPGIPPGTPRRGSAHGGAALQPRLRQSAAASPKDSYFFFSSSIKGRSDSIRAERREEGTMPAQQAGRGRPAA